MKKKEIQEDRRFYFQRSVSLLAAAHSCFHREPGRFGVPACSPGDGVGEEILSISVRNIA